MRFLAKTPTSGWYQDAAEPEGSKVRKTADDQVFENLGEAQGAMQVMQSITAGSPAAEQASEQDQEAAKATTSTERVQKAVADKPPAQTTVSPTGKVLVGKTVTIKCKHKGCKETRVCKPQDVFQVKYCVPHQIEHRKAAQKAKRQARAAERKAAKVAAAA